MAVARLEVYIQIISVFRCGRLFLTKKERRKAALSRVMRKNGEYVCEGTKVVLRN